MNPEYMARMTAAELDEYAKALGFSVVSKKGRDAKSKAIEERRGRCATVRALGIDFEIPIRRMHDKRVVELFANARKDDSAAFEFMESVLGAEQMAQLVEACTEADGSVDVDAMGLAMVRIAYAPELKNF
ncbi:MAG: hypothetical protein Q4B35_06430 [Slackia sp.]|nr:hypothetical protein [Slackia sp.]